jgi:protein-arginine kinase activator protein McsA
VGELTKQVIMNKKEIEDKIAELNKKKEEATKNQDYPYATLMRDRIKEMNDQLKEKTK